MDELIYDATGANPLFPGDAVLVRTETGIFQGQARRVWYDFSSDSVVERVQVVAFSDNSRTRKLVLPSQCIKTFVHKGMIWIPAGIWKELDPSPGDEILAFSVKKHIWVECGFVSPENGCCYKITIGGNEFVVPTNMCAVQCYPGIY